MVGLGFASRNSSRALSNKPVVPRTQVGFVHWPIAPPRHIIRGVLHCPPEIADETILVVDRLDCRLVSPREQHGAGTEERLDVVLHNAEPLPNGGSNAGLAAEPGERRLQSHHVATPNISAM